MKGTRCIAESVDLTDGGCGNSFSANEKGKRASVGRAIAHSVDRSIPPLGPHLCPFPLTSLSPKQVLEERLCSHRPAFDVLCIFRPDSGPTLLSDLSVTLLSFRGLEIQARSLKFP